MTGLRSFQATLQTQITLADKEWNYTVKGLPKAKTTNDAGLVKSISFTSSSTQEGVQLRLKAAPSNRVTSSEPLNGFLLLSFANFRLREPSADGTVSFAPARDSSGYILRLLRSGVTLNGVHYHFFGHSNSQLKSRSCFLYAASKDEIAAKVNAMGNFSKMNTVAKKAKRIGLLFSSAEMATKLDPERCEDIDDIELGDYCFTDGCGLISKQLAQLLVQRRNIVFRNKRYLPSVFQIRYRGYKGVLTIDPRMSGKTQVKFRQSMKKFTAHGDLSLSVVESSKPYTFGFLNDEIVVLLHALGISAERLLEKQQQYLDFLDRVAEGRAMEAFQFLSLINETQLAEKMLMGGIETVMPSLKGLVCREQSKTLNKYEEQRCRIMIRQSRLLFGVCDPTGTPSKAGLLKPGTCFVRITLDGTGEARTVINTDVLVTRNPCLHPGDLQKFRAVNVPELSHLSDVIVFPTNGKRPSADLMSGGDLDGDKFFVTWDPDLLPKTVSQPAAYPGVKERVTFGPISDDDRAEFFAKYTSASLGRLKNLWLAHARVKGAMSSECQQLNRLFSQCVDGNRIKVPQSLEDPSEPSAATPQFILDVLHDAAKGHMQTCLDNDEVSSAAQADTMELLASRDNFALSEFELVQLVLRRCGPDGLAFAEYAPYFNFSALTDDQQAWLLARLPPAKGMPALIKNGLLQSSLVTPMDLSHFRLDDPRLHWKSIFKSDEDRMGRFLSATSRSLELFHKKLIVLQADERLTLMIYIPQKIAQSTEVEVGDSVRVFALPKSSGSNSAGYRVTPVRSNSRIFSDDNTFQLYEAKRANTFVYLTRGQQDKASFQHLKSAGDRRRQAQKTVDDGLNFENRASVALNKISEPIRQHVGRMNRAGILSAEVYVISNRDVESMRFLDQWLSYIDTEEVLPLFEPTKKDYFAPSLENIERADIAANVASVVWDEDLSSLRTMTDITDMRQTLQLLNDVNKKTQMLAVCSELIDIGTTGSSSISGATISRALLTFLPTAPFLAEIFLDSPLWQTTKDSLAPEADAILQDLLKGLILYTNRMQALVRLPFKMVLRELKQISEQFLTEIVELIALAVQQSEFALDLLLECLEPECSRLILSTPRESQRLAKSLAGIALDHIEEAGSSRPSTTQTLNLQRDGSNEGFEVVKATLRIDAPGGPPKVGDHVRLSAMSPPTNAPLDRPYVMDALVISSGLGLVRFRCLHPVPAFVSECSWKLRQCGSFVTSRAMLDAVSALYATKSGSCRLWQQVIGIRGDKKTGFVQNPDKGHLALAHLNASQSKAVEAATRYPLTLLWGPPGTGKTHTVVEVLKQLLILHPEHRFLVTAPTHNAVDNLMQRFLRENDSNLATKRPLRVSTDLNKVASALRQYTCDAMVGKDLSEGFAGRSQAQKRVKESTLIFTTCAGAALGLLRSEEFGIVIVDEASQITEPGTLIPLTKGCQRAVLVGDHVQLRATVQKSAVLTGHDISLFERLYTTPDRDDVAKVMLDTQYRMHPDLSAFSSNTFYDGKLQTAAGLEQLELPSSQFPWPVNGRKVFVQCTEPEDIGRQSKSNQGQVRLCKMVCDLLSTEPTSSDIRKDSIVDETKKADIAILTPYTRQRELLQTALPGYAISSIDGFQGREADIVIFVTVRCNAHHDIGFLSDLRRLNVVMTRARKGVIIIGHQSTLTVQQEEEGVDESKKVWKQLIESCANVEIGRE